jgi:hypothetical protein
MPNVRNFPVGTIGWTGSTMRENLQEDIFLPCDDRLVAVNVGPDGTYGSLVFDTNQNNEYDPERSAYLQSAFRVLKKPLGQPNAIGFQLYWAGNKDTKGGYFVDQGDGSKTVQNVATPSIAQAGSGMVATGFINQISKLITTDGNTNLNTTGAGSSGGTVIGQGSFNDGGPFHVGNKNDIHNHGKDADGNPINSLHIWTGANFYKNQVQDGPLRFENQYQKGSDQSIIVPVHLGWAGKDWAWYTTSYMYQPTITVPHQFNPFPPYTTPTTPSTVITPDNPTIPTVPVTGGGVITGDKGNHPPGGGFTPSIGDLPGYTTGVGGVATGGVISYGPGSSGGPSDPGAGGGTNPPPTPSGGGNGPQYQDSSGQPSEDNVILRPDGSQLEPPTGYGPGGQPQPEDDPSAGDQGGLFGGTPAGPSKGSGGGDGSGGGGGTSTSGYPVHALVPDLPLQLSIPFNPQPPIITSSLVGNNSLANPLNLVYVAGALNTAIQTFQAASYLPNSTANAAISAVASGSAISKGNDTAPQTGGASSFAGQGGTLAGGTTGSGAPFPANSGGGQGDPWLYTASPRNQQMSSSMPKSKYRGGTANGGICYHPAETDLRDAQSNGMTPPGVTLNEFLVMTAPKAYFGCGVPELVNGSIKSGFRWGVDATNGDLVFGSISSSQTAVEAMRFTNTSQRIQWQSQRGVYGELAHYNTSSRTWTFQDASGYVICSNGNFGLFGTTPIGQQTVGANVNNVVASGVTGQFDDFTNGVVYATDYAALHATVSQLCRTVAQLTSMSRTYGLGA